MGLVVALGMRCRLPILLATMDPQADLVHKQSGQGYNGPGARLALTSDERCLEAVRRC